MTTPENEAKAKRPYVKPSLRVYGDLAGLTKSSTNTNTGTDGGGALDKT